VGKLGIWVKNEPQAPYKSRNDSVSSTFEVVPNYPKSR